MIDLPFGHRAHTAHCRSIAREGASTMPSSEFKSLLPEGADDAAAFTLLYFPLMAKVRAMPVDV